MLCSMKMRDRCRLAFNVLTGKSSPGELDNFWYHPVPTGQTSAGVKVSPDSAMRATAVYACVRLLSGVGGFLPISLYKKTSSRRRTTAPEHRVHHVLHDYPNPEQTAYEYKRTVWIHLKLRGNHFSWIERAKGEIVAVWPIHPDRVRVKRERNGPLYYDVQSSDGSHRNYPAEEILHIKNMSLDGTTGLSPILSAMQAVGLSLATEEYGAAFFSNSAHASGMFKPNNDLVFDEEQRKQIRDSWNEVHQGPSKGSKIGVFPFDMDFQKISISPDEAQFLETRRFQLAEVCRLYGVPSWMINDTERSTSWGSGIEQQGIGFVIYTLQSELVNIEQSMARALLTPAEQEQYYFKHNVDALMRGDAKSRAIFYKMMREIGAFSIDDVRALEDRDPLPNGLGAEYNIPANWKTLGQKPPPVPTHDVEPPKPGAQEDEKTQNRRLAVMVGDQAGVKRNGSSKAQKRF